MVSTALVRTRRTAFWSLSRRDDRFGPSSILLVGHRVRGSAESCRLAQSTLRPFPQKVRRLNLLRAVARTHADSDAYAADVFSSLAVTINSKRHEPLRRVLLV